MPELTYSRVNRDLLRTLETPGRRYFLLIGVLLMGVAFFAFSEFTQIYRGMGMSGKTIPVGWAVYITTFVFWVGIGHAGTLISAILYLFGARWRTAVYRSAEMMTVFAVLTAGLFPLIHLGRSWYFYWLVPYPNQRELWPNFRSPLIWDVFAVSTYLTVSSMFLFLGLIPDLAAIRDRARGWRKKLYTVLSLGWRGGDRQWRHFNAAYLFFAAFATPLVISVHSVVSWDFTMGIVPGWHSTIFAPYFVAGAIHSGLAMVIVLLVPLRKVFRLEQFLEIHHFEQMSKLMIATGLIIGYAYGIEFFVAWYSGNEFEWSAFVHRAFGAYWWMFWAMVLFNCVLPMLFFFRNVRRSFFWLVTISVLVNVGMWFERFVIIAVSLMHDYDPATWQFKYEFTWVEAGILGGSFCWFLSWFFIFAKIFPTVSMMEIKEAMPPPLKKAPPPAGQGAHA
ncbi:MAG: NrfD/PsrC family molybdoenzyme membrane anchor subunit [Candidatus Acidiferrales bacterium]